MDVDGRLSESARLTVTLDYLAKRSPTERSLMEGSAESQAYLDQKDNIRSSNLTAQTNLEIKASEKIKLDIGVNGIITKTKATMIFIKLISRRVKTASTTRKKKLMLMADVTIQYHRK